MNAMFGVRWNDNVKRGTLAGFMVAILFATSFLSTPEAQHALSAVTSDFVSVIVRSEPGTNGDRIEQVVQDLGGSVEEELRIINGYVANVPADRVPQLKREPGVHSVTVNGRVKLMSHNDYGIEQYARDVGSLNYVAQGATGAIEYYRSGYAGRGVDVALIDSGVAPVEGLSRTGKVIYGPDLSFESQADNLRNHDSFGHGTHMAGIIAGLDSRFQRGMPFFAGVAPMSRIVSLKVADSKGATDVSQIIAAIDWVVQHRRDNGMNIRVLNLSFGTDGTQDYRLDPLTYAAEVAWRKGIVVVVAAGNAGFGSAKLNNPAYDPFVIAVGGTDTNDTWRTSDDTLGTFSSHGDGTRNPDLVAPGKSIVSLRTPGSAADVEYPEGRVGERFFRGSGTSQAAAVVSGAAALVIDQRPRITPNQVKALLTRTAKPLPAADPRGQGAGLIDLEAAKSTPTPANATQRYEPATGTGSLEQARGSSHLIDGGTELWGERDIFGQPFDAKTWALESLAGLSWSGGTWNANRWSGDSWLANRWSSTLWEANRWSANRWSANRWSANRWSANRWSGDDWWDDDDYDDEGYDDDWSSNRWSSNRWSSAGWGY